MTQYLYHLIGRFRPSASEPPAAEPSNLPKLALVGAPNVGKSALFNVLTGEYAAVSNYPGTTVEVFRGRLKSGAVEMEVVDTPGMYSLQPISEEEDVARQILAAEKPAVVIQVADARNLERMLVLTLELLEAGLPLVLVLNMMDEARAAGMRIDLPGLSRLLGIPVLATVASKGLGVTEVVKAVERFRPPPPSEPLVRYGLSVEKAITRVAARLSGKRYFSRRALSLLLIQGDGKARDLSGWNQASLPPSVAKTVEQCRQSAKEPLNYQVAVKRQQKASSLGRGVTETSGRVRLSAAEALSRLSMNPVTGFPVFLLILFGFYEFVGVLGAQVLVDGLERHLFVDHLNPLMTSLVERLVPFKAVQDLLVHEFGIFTLGVRYGVAIILPLVSTFFLAFSMVEDSGYLPRLAMLIDRAFKQIGLNGRAVIPLVLGFGCDTMAVLVTRTLETKRERLLATFLMALAIPCSAQLGVIFALLAGHHLAMVLWIFIMCLIFMGVGALAARVLPGDKPLFYMELPPLRLPKASNIFLKTWTRVVWYFREIMPLFILASVILWLGNLTGGLRLAVRLLEKPLAFIGLPPQTAVAVIYGFFRRDYGAAGLYDLKQSGILDGVPLLTAVVMLALFIPCIAQFSITAKERGLKTALGMAAFIFPFAFLVAGLVNWTLTGLGVRL